MIIYDRIKKFEELSMGMFVHFGLYSLMGRGEWIYNFLSDEERAEYLKELPKKFNPDSDWAEKLVATAKAAGCKYITLTTRHHDGFSLYDTCGLNDFDAPHAAAGRDLVREFVDACRAEEIVPFFYHTLLDWYVPEYKTDFPKYLKYLRDSVEILCTRYGEIGGLWFDGKWNKRDADWEEDALYGMIRRHQPEAMIINNTGMTFRGQKGNPEIDSLTFERGNPEPYEFSDDEKYLSREMCQVFADHWGYAEADFDFKSLPQIIKDVCTCRRYGANYLLNVGPMANGKLRRLDEAMLMTLGEWIADASEAVYGTKPSDLKIENKETDFIVEGENASYLFCYGLPIKGSADVTLLMQNPDFWDVFESDGRKIESVTWLDAPEKSLTFKEENGKTTIYTTPYGYGTHRVVRIAKIKWKA